MKQVLVSYKTRSEKLALIRDIVSEVQGARDHETWPYRGLTIRKTKSTTRGGSVIAVLGPDGNSHGKIDTSQERPVDILDMVEDIRRECFRNE